MMMAPSYLSSIVNVLFADLDIDIQGKYCFLCKLKSIINFS